jgi:hypothetical protein
VIVHDDLGQNPAGARAWCRYLGGRGKSRLTGRVGPIACPISGLAPRADPQPTSAKPPASWRAGQVPIQAAERIMTRPLRLYQARSDVSSGSSIDKLDKLNLDAGGKRTRGSRLGFAQQVGTALGVLAGGPEGSGTCSTDRTAGSLRSHCSTWLTSALSRTPTTSPPAGV